MHHIKDVDIYVHTRSLVDWYRSIVMRIAIEAVIR